MTTYIPFQASTNSAFQFKATLDGLSYTIVVTWNLHGQRYYVSIYDASSTLLICEPLISSPPTSDISMLGPLNFTSTLIYRDSTGNFEVSP